MRLGIFRASTLAVKTDLKASDLPDFDAVKRVLGDLA